MPRGTGVLTASRRQVGRESELDLLLLLIIILMKNSQRSRALKLIVPGYNIQHEKRLPKPVMEF